jgi:hypothetical protein
VIVLPDQVVQQPLQRCILWHRLNAAAWFWCLIRRCSALWSRTCPSLRVLPEEAVQRFVVADLTSLEGVEGDA